MKKALFFDMDGTLWNALEQLLDAYNEAMANENEPYRFDLSKIQSYMGLTPEETAVLAFPDRPLEEGLKLFHDCYLNELVYLKKHPGTLYPEEEKVLRELSVKYPLYLVSNADKGYLETYLEAYGFDTYYKGHLAAGDTGLAKWQNILLLKEKEGIDEVIYIGDTAKDKAESEKAGVKFIHAAYGFGVIEESCPKIMSLRELPERVEEVFSLENV